MVRQADLESLRELDEVWTELQGVATYRRGNITTGTDEREFTKLQGRAQILYGKTNQFTGIIWLANVAGRRDCFQTILGLPSIAYWRQPLIPDAWSAASSGIKQAIGQVEAQLQEQPEGDEPSSDPIGSLHDEIVQRSGDLFQVGKYEEAALNAMKAVEVRIRRLISGSDEDIGLGLVSKALNPNNPLLVISEVTAEQEAFHSLFRGAIGAFKNPSSHRFLNTSDPVKTLEVLALSSLLMRLLDEAKVMGSGE